MPQQPFTFPSWMTTTPNMRELQQTYRQLPGQFDTSGMEANVNAQMGMNTAQGKASSAVMQKAAQSRAARMGGSAAVSFAAGGMMLPIMQQNAAMQGDFQNRKLAATSQMAGLRQNAAATMARLRQQQMGMGAGFYGDEIGRQQNQGQFDASLAQRGREFDTQSGMQDRQQDFIERQYRDRLKGLGGYGVGGGGGGNERPNWGEYNTMMIAANTHAPQAAASHQRMQAAASAAGINGRPSFSTIYI